MSRCTAPVPVGDSSPTGMLARGDEGAEGALGWKFSTGGPGRHKHPQTLINDHSAAPCGLKGKGKGRGRDKEGG